MFRATLRWFLHMLSTRGAIFLGKGALEEQLFKSYVIIYSKREIKVKIMKATKRLSSLLIILSILTKLDSFHDEQRRSKVVIFSKCFKRKYFDK